MTDIDTWMKRHYPCTAQEVAKDWEDGKLSTLGLIDHSIQKWEGLDRAYLHRFGLAQSPSSVVEFENVNRVVLWIDSSTCSLCQAFDPGLARSCKGCPLYESRGQFSCDKAMRGREALSPWGHWSRYGDPRPMLEALRKSYAYQLLKDEEPPATFSA